MTKLHEHKADSLELTLDLVGLVSCVYAWAILFASPFVPLYLYVYEAESFAQWQEQEGFVYQVIFLVIACLIIGGITKWFAKSIIERKRKRVIIAGLLILLYGVYLAYAFIEAVFLNVSVNQNINAIGTAVYSILFMGVGLLTIIAGFKRINQVKCNEP